jgi:hypothetical protein
MTYNTNSQNPYTGAMLRFIIDGKIRSDLNVPLFQSTSNGNQSARDLSEQGALNESLRVERVERVQESQWTQLADGIQKSFPLGSSGLTNRSLND